MTHLISSQLTVMVIMTFCGLSAGLVTDIFRIFIHRFLSAHRLLSLAAKGLFCLTVAFLISDYIFYSSSGKITLASCIFFGAGLWLWKKYLHDIITPRL